MHTRGKLYSEDFKIFFEMFIIEKLKSINLFFDVSTFISKCQVGLSTDNMKKMGVTKVILIYYKLI